MTPGITLVIAARNGSATIERALRSATGDAVAAIVLVDDWSSDDTAARARAVGGSRLRILRPDGHRTLGFARQTAIDAVNTPFGIWLDADDEWLPGRADRLLDALVAGPADFAYDGAEVLAPAAGAEPVEAPIPAFMHAPGAAVRLFERSYLPTLGVFGFRSDAMKRLGYDVTLHGGEDLDVALRAVAGGYRFAFVAASGYRIRTSAESLSRHASNQRAMCRAGLAKHSDEDVLALYAAAGFNFRIARWALVSMAVFREDYRGALELVDEGARLCEDEAEILEPEGPEPWPEKWRLLFARGTLSLLMNRMDDAIAALTHAEEVRPTAEGANNLGVALKHSGRSGPARILFATAVERRPDYADAHANLAGARADHVTTHPLRAHATRTDYAPTAAVSATDGRSSIAAPQTNFARRTGL
jgi:tetratricopeptide (TPR) repeat protein